MPLVDLNLGGVSSAGKPLPEDSYEFRLEDAKAKLAKDGNSWNILMTLRVVSENQNGRIHKENQNVQDSTMPFVKAWLSALWNCTDEEIDDMQMEVDDRDGTVVSIGGQPVVGFNVIGTIKHVVDNSNPDQPKTYANVVGWAAA